MSTLVWDKSGEKLYESGVSKGVLYDFNSETKKYTPGVVWNGLTAVNESPEGGDATDLWADNIKYGSLRAAEKFGFTIEAYQSPVEFDKCDGSAYIGGANSGVSIRQQTRQTFGFCYRTEIGSDTNPDEGYKLHLYYGCTASPSSRDHATTNDSPDAGTLSWDCDTVPVEVTGYKPTSVVEINSTTISAANLKKLEDKLYGTSSSEPELPMPNEVMALIAQG